MNKDLQTFNELWGIMKMRPLTQEEYDRELKAHPDLWRSYSLQKKIAEKYPMIIKTVV